MLRQRLLIYGAFLLVFGLSFFGTFRVLTPPSVPGSSQLAQVGAGTISFLTSPINISVTSGAGSNQNFYDVNDPSLPTSTSSSGQNLALTLESVPPEIAATLWNIDQGICRPPGHPLGCPHFGLNIQAIVGGVSTPNGTYTFNVRATNPNDGTTATAPVNVTVSGGVVVNPNPPPAASCGNGSLDSGETCDGANLNNQTCTTIAGGFTGGTLACNSTCDGYNSSQCVIGTTNPPPTNPGSTLYVDLSLAADCLGQYNPGAASGSRCGASSGGTEFAYARFMDAYGVIQAGQTIAVRGGTYNCQNSYAASQLNTCANQDIAVWPLNKSGTASSPITIEGYGSETVVISGAGNNGAAFGHRWGINLTGNYTHLSKLNATEVLRWAFDIAGQGNQITYSSAYGNSPPGNSWDSGFQIEPGTRNFLVDHVASFNNGAGITVGHPSANSIGITYYNPANPSGSQIYDRSNPPQLLSAPVWVDGGRVSNSVVFNNTTCSENSDGLGGDYARNVVVEDNVIFGNADDGLDFLGSFDNTFQNNISFDNGDLRTPAPGAQQCDPGGGGDGSGIKIGTRGGGGNIFRNNVSFGNIKGYDNDDGQGDIYYHNVAYKNKDFGFWLENNIDSHNFVTGTILLNNISIQNTAGQIWQDANTPGIDWNHNLSTGAGNVVFQNPPAVVPGWQAYYQYLNVDPTGDGRTDWNDIPSIQSQVRQMFSLPSGSPAIDAGVNLQTELSAKAATPGLSSQTVALINHALATLGGSSSFGGNAPDQGAYESGFSGNPPPTTDTQAPTAPANLAAGSLLPTSLVLTWSPATDNVGVTGYVVKRGGSPIATTTAPTYPNTGLTPATAYSYTVTAFDAAGNLSAPASLTVTTPAASYTITASAGAGGSISPSGSVSVNYAAGQTFMITPNAGYQRATLLIDGISQTPQASYAFSNVAASHTIAATFSSVTQPIPPLVTYVLNLTSGTGGTAAPSLVQSAYGAGTSLVLTATPQAGYYFTGWSGDLTSSLNPASVVMTANKSIQANFALHTTTAPPSPVTQSPPTPIINPAPTTKPAVKPAPASPGTVKPLPGTVKPAAKPAPTGFSPFSPPASPPLPSYPTPAPYDVSSSDQTPGGLVAYLKNFPNLLLELIQRLDQWLQTKGW